MLSRLFTRHISNILSKKNARIICFLMFHRNTSSEQNDRYTVENFYSIDNSSPKRVRFRTIIHLSPMLDFDLFEG